MPRRYIKFNTDGIYHVFNRSLDKRFVFVDQKICNHFLTLVSYYRSSNARLSFSNLQYLSKVDRVTLIESTLDPASYTVNILAFCLMPTHFHLLLQQRNDQSINKTMAKILNSFTKYYNLRYRRFGPLFNPQFKAVSVDSDSQLMHVSRYIHLNPYSSEVVKNLEKLNSYRWSSLPYYLDVNKSLYVQKEIVLKLFGNDLERYKKFVFSNAEYQKKLDEIKKWEKPELPRFR